MLTRVLRYCGTVLEQRWDPGAVAYVYVENFAKWLYIPSLQRCSLDSWSHFYLPNIGKSLSKMALTRLLATTIDSELPRAIILY